jgi:hypothetical protein
MAQTERLQASLPHFAMQELTRLSEEFGVDKSAVVQEALSLFFKAALEAKQGSRIAFLPASETGAIREFSTPLLAHMEQSARTGPEEITLPDRDFDRVVESLDEPAAPTSALRELTRRRRKENP